MKACITGGAGFIGSNLADRLLAGGHEVVVLDNFSTGRREFLRGALEHPAFELVSADVFDKDALARAVNGCDIVFHLSANADVRFGLDHPGKDLEQNTIATFRVLEAMRNSGTRRIAFASTGSVYGEAQIIPTPEDAPFPVQTSLYAASKLACEGLIEAYCEGFGFQGFIFRFVSVLGERYTHGHVFDFYKKLKSDPRELSVLGDGHQKKSYMHVGDCIDAMLLAAEKARDRVNIFNLGTDGYIEVVDSLRWICEHMGASPRVSYTGGSRGWTGDNPFIFLDCAKIRSLGWQPVVGIREGVIRTLEYFDQNPWVLDRD